SYDKSLPIKDEKMYDKDGYQGDDNTTEYLDDLNVSWTLPLLKNKNGVLDQKTYDLAVLDYEDERLVLAEAKEDFIEDKLTTFFDWVNYHTQIDIVKNRLKNSKLILETMQVEDMGKSSILTLQRSINKTQRLLLDLESKLKAQQRLIDALLTDINLEDNPLKINWSSRAKLIQDLHQYCKASVRDIKRIEIEQLKNKRSVESYQNSELADFDFTISATQDDNKGNYSTYSKSSEVEYEAKLVFSYPLTGDVSNDVYLSKYRLKNRQLELKYQDKFDDIVSDAQKLTTELKQGVKQLALYQQQVDENKASNVETELDAFLAGNGNIRFVINEQDDQQSLLLEQIEASINYHKNRIKYDSLMDRLLVSAL
ncbi:MAG: TolC family protein, partial [Gammaproteobacteria bacterium]